jgi:hypothetical protein
MQLRPIGYSLAIALFLAPAAVLANRGDKYGRVNEVPPQVQEIPVFVCDRVEMAPGLAFERPGPVGPIGSEPLTRNDVPVPDGRNPICACRAETLPNGQSHCSFWLPVI